MRVHALDELLPHLEGYICQRETLVYPLSVYVTAMQMDVLQFITRGLPCRYLREGA